MENQGEIIALIKALSGGGSGGASGILVGNVKETDTSFPATRPTGEDLQAGDYVTPSSGATFPFTIEEITFNATNDRAIWNGSKWIYQGGQNVIQWGDVKNKPFKTIDGVTIYVDDEGVLHARGGSEEKMIEILNDVIYEIVENKKVPTINYVKSKWAEIEGFIRSNKVVLFGGEVRYLAVTDLSGSVSEDNKMLVLNGYDYNVFFYLNNSTSEVTRKLDIFAKKEDIENKQDKLIAGANITIEGNVISTTEGKKQAFLYKNKKMDYLYEIGYDNFDYEFAKNYFHTYSPEEYKMGSCSSIVKNGILARNYDWLLSEEVSFVVQTEHTLSNYASYGVASGVAELTKSFVESGEISDAYKILPFFMNEGMNEHGLCISTNVVPIDKGENKEINPSGAIQDEICTLMLVRYVLDKFKTVDECIEQLTNHVKLFTPQKIIEMGYNQHFILSDGFKSVVIEFKNGNYEIKNNFNYITNFHVADVVLNDDGSVFTPADVEKSGSSPADNFITSHGQGLERWNLINEEYSEIRNATDFKELLQKLFYTKMYSNSIEPSSPFWYTEYVGKEIENTKPPTAFTTIVAEEAEKYSHRTRNKETWESVHSTIYDFKNNKFYLCSEENKNNWIEYDLFIKSSGGDITKAEVEAMDAEVLKQSKLYADTKIIGVRTAENQIINGVSVPKLTVDDLQTLFNAHQNGHMAFVQDKTSDNIYIVRHSYNEDDGSQSVVIDYRGVMVLDYNRKAGSDTVFTTYTPIGGGGGTYSYNDLVGKPKLNGVELKDNHTIADYGGIDKAQGAEHAGEFLFVNEEGNIDLKKETGKTVIKYWDLPVDILYVTETEIKTKPVKARVLEYAIAENKYRYTLNADLYIEDTLSISVYGALWTTRYPICFNCAEETFAEKILDHCIFSACEGYIPMGAEQPRITEKYPANMGAFNLVSANERGFTNFAVVAYGEVLSDTPLLTGGTPIVNALMTGESGGSGNVTSVCGKVGDVLLNKNDVGLDQIDNTSDERKKYNFTGAIEELNDGFVTGNMAFEALLQKQDTLNSGLNIKTINGQSVLGEGDLEIETGEMYFFDITGTSGTFTEEQTGLINTVPQKVILKNNLMVFYFADEQSSKKSWRNVALDRVYEIEVTNSGKNWNLKQGAVAENAINKVSVISAGSTDIQYPTAKCVYDLVGDVADVLYGLTRGGGV